MRRRLGCIAAILVVWPCLAPAGDEAPPKPAWSYDPEMPTTKDQVRLLIGDTDGDSPQLENEEIAWFLAQEVNVYLAAAAASVCPRD